VVLSLRLEGSEEEAPETAEGLGEHMKEFGLYPGSNWEPYEGLKGGRMAWSDL
jgi:hypothetical protein